MEAFEEEKGWERLRLTLNGTERECREGERQEGRMREEREREREGERGRGV